MMTNYPVKGYKLVVDASSGTGAVYREIRRESDNVVVWYADPSGRFSEAWADYRCRRMLRRLKKHRHD